MWKTNGFLWTDNLSLDMEEHYPFFRSAVQLVFRRPTLRRMPFVRSAIRSGRSVALDSDRQPNELAPAYGRRRSPGTVPLQPRVEDRVLP